MVSTKRFVQQVLRHSESVVRDRRWTTRHVTTILQGLQQPAPPPFRTALFNFTIDFELVWGNGNLGGCGHSAEKRLQAARAQIENFAPFMQMLEDLSFPISWAIVGKLVAPETQLPPFQQFRPEWYTEDWYALPAHPGLTERDWQGAPFLDYVRRSPLGHEVLSHGYGHIDYADAATTPEVARTDMQLSRRLLEDAGFRIDGFVFPCNRIGHAGLLPGLGYRIARGDRTEWRLGEAPIPMTPVGFCINPGFLSFTDVKQIIDTGIARRAFVHPWMHLVECSLRQHDLNNFYRPLFAYILEQQAKGRIQNISFRALADGLVPVLSSSAS